ncbi:unnamed protein product [Owenia fusiformis]|uniref:Uncharacterized protein n=1 Tax=Owenia fusiformis TaxID=6347 RepID=A0A8J1T6G6_OWEFU|nr:unnamed protein product [Owenia fusiformis]
MADIEDKPQKPKEAAVLTEGSLGYLAKEIPDPIILGMYLNIPNTRLVDYTIDPSSQANVADMSRKVLMFWKQMRETAKEKDKVADLDRALRSSGKHDLAETLLNKHQDGMELTPDCFAL